MAESVERNDAVLIDLRSRLDVRKLSGRGEFIQQAALRKLASLIAKRIADIASAARAVEPEDLDADGSNILFDRRHDTILIHGSRGSGKTTFIRNAFRLFREEPSYRSAIGSKAVMLGVVDPTLVGSKENVFVIILNKIKTAIERHRQQNGAWGCAGDGRVTYEAWRDTLNSLAQGLSLLDGIGPDKQFGEAWEDAHYVLRKGLEKADAGSSLETKFHAFIEDSLALLGKQVFLMALDDIDTNFERGWQILEVLRRYLTSPRFIVVMSGDMDLYAMLVRAQQWEHFSSRQLERDTKQGDELEQMVGHLQSQFLLKVLPPHNRISLQSLGAMQNVSVIPVNGGKPRPLKEFMHGLLEEGLGLRGSAQRKAYELLLRQPVRTVLQIMALHRPADGSEAGVADEAWLSLAEGLPAIFLDGLLRRKTSLDELHQATDTRLLGFITKFLTRNELWDEAHNLLAEHADDDLNLVLLTAGAWVRDQSIRNPGLALDYMLRIGLSHELLTSRLQTLRVVDREDEPLEIEEFSRYAELEREGSSLEVARRFVAIINGEGTSGVQLGTVQTHKRDARLRSETIADMYGSKTPPERITFSNYPPSVPSHIEPFHSKIQDAFNRAELLNEPTRLIGNWYNTIDSLQERLNRESLRAFAGLPACRVMTPKGERPTFVSVHSLIAFVAELMSQPADADFRDVARLLRNASLIRSYPIPPWTAVNAFEPDSEDDDEFDAQESEAEYSLADDPLVHGLLDWKSGHQEILHMPPPHILARICSRFYFSLASLDETPRKDRFLGHLLHRGIVLFLNSVLVEELLYWETDKVSLKNPTFDDQIFLRNSRHMPPLFSALYTCPVWSMYLDPRSPVGVAQRKAAGFEEGFHSLMVKYEVRQASQHANRGTSPAAPGESGFAYFDNLFPLLNSVSVTGVAAKPEPDRPVRGRRRGAVRPAEPGDES